MTTMSWPRTALGGGGGAGTLSESATEGVLWDLTRACSAPPIAQRECSFPFLPRFIEQLAYLLEGRKGFLRKAELASSTISGMWEFSG